MSKVIDYMGDEAPVKHPDSYLSKPPSTTDLYLRIIEIAKEVCGEKAVERWQRQEWADFSVVALSTESMVEDFPKADVDKIQYYASGKAKPDTPWLNLNAPTRRAYRRRGVPDAYAA